jgi:hypothetical protein
LAPSLNGTAGALSGQATAAVKEPSPEFFDARAPLHRAPPAAEEMLESTRTLLRLSSLSVAAGAAWAAQPAGLQEAEQPAADHAGPESATRDMVAGIWAPDAGTCSARNFRDGALPTIINAEGAWAGDTFCMFTDKKQTETGWRVVATCSNPRERWKSNVRLAVSENRLTWTSRRGTQAYTRCAPDVLVAEAR